MDAGCRYAEMYAVCLDIFCYLFCVLYRHHSTQPASSVSRMESVAEHPFFAPGLKVLVFKLFFVEAQCSRSGFIYGMEYALPSLFVLQT